MILNRLTLSDMEIFVNAENFFYETSRNIKRLLTVLIDATCITAAYWLALLVKFESFSVFSSYQNWLYFAFLVPLSLIFYIKLGVYRSYQRFFGARSIILTFIAILLSFASLVTAGLYFGQAVTPLVAFLYFAFLALFTSSTRLALRIFYSIVASADKKQVLIYGAGEAGRQLAKSLASSPEYHVVGFLDDDPKLHGYYFDGHQVNGIAKLGYLIEKYSVERVLLAMPSSPRGVKKRILEKLEQFPVKVKTIPGMVDLVEGDTVITEVKDVEIEDLLGRDPVPPQQDLFEANIKYKVVLVTGAGGSIGSELCRQIIVNRPNCLLLFEVSEFALYAIESELSQLITSENLSIKLISFLGSVQDRNLLDMLFKTYEVDTVYHAAAYKHVPLVEFNVAQGVKNNIFGTKALAESAMENGVDTFVLISTDKAVRPTNFMGTTKRMAELVLQALSAESRTTRFCMVRFGNVLGSSGSVIPLFRKQIQAGGPVTVTHKDITRYFMTIPEAAQLVIQAGAMGRGGDVFVLDMGDSVRIYDLAKRLIRLSGLSVKDTDHPDGDIEIVCTGLRPGEKLYEELLIGDNVLPTNHERIMSAIELSLPLVELEDMLDALNQAVLKNDAETMRAILQKAPAGYSPSSAIVDNFHMNVIQ